MQRKIISLALSLVLFLSLLGGISFFQKTSKVIADEVEGIQLSVLKVWDDYNDLDELRPDSVEVTLYQNNQKTNIKATLSANNNWYYKYDTLVAKEDSSGEKINYTWRCDEIDDYERFEDNLDNMYIITDVHHVEEPSVNSVVLQKFNEKDEFFDGCNMILKNQSGDTLITWTTNDSSSIDIKNNNLSASMNSDGSLVVNNIPEGEYVYEEVKPKSGYTNAGRKEFKIEKGVHNYTYNWYTDIQDAVTDANNLNNNNADCYRDDDNCKVGMFIIGDVAHFILIEDVNTKTVSLNVDTIFDLDNKTFSQSNNANFIYLKDLKMIDGNVNLSTNRGIIATDIKTSGIPYNSDGKLIVKNVDITNEINSGNIFTLNHCGDDFLIEDVNILTSSSSGVSSSSGITCFNVSGFHLPDNGKIINSSFISTSDNTNADFNVSAINVCTLKSLDIINCTCRASSYSSVSRAININTPDFSAKDFLIKDCELYSESQNTSYCIDCDNGKNITLDNNSITSKGGDHSFGVDIDKSNQNVIALDNSVECYAVSPESYSSYTGFRIYQSNSLALKSGNIYIDPVRDDNSESDGTGHYNSFGVGVDNSGTLIVDESKGSNVVIGGYSSVVSRIGAFTTLNSGTFKAPNHVILDYSGSTGSFEINGGVYKSNRNEYSESKLNGIWDFAPIYLLGSSNDDYYNCNIRNATIEGGTYGIVLKSFSPTCHLYNCNISGSRLYNIRFDDSSHNRNVYCYVEDGTVLSHDGTEFKWSDKPFDYGYGEHVIDNRQTQTTIQETTGGGE